LLALAWASRVEEQWILPRFLTELPFLPLLNEAAVFPLGFALHHWRSKKRT
jgi:hypothetical protein